MARTTKTAEAGRPVRTPLGQRNKLSVKGIEPGYQYRFVNDTEDRIAAFQDAGYELVDASTVRVGDKRIDTATPEGSKAQISAGKGTKAFLMRIKEDWYKEDQKAKQDFIDEQENAIKTKTPGADYGSVSISRN